MSSVSDPFPACKTKEEAIHCYLERLNEIKKMAKREYGINSNEFDKMFENEFVREHLQCTTPISIEHSERISKHDMKYNDMYFIRYVYSQLRRYAVRIIFLVIVLILFNYRAELSRVFMREIQVYIYPVMRLWRKLTLPIIRQFPQLTQLYDETCLISNPFFRVANLDCSPCINVFNVVDLSIVPQFDYLGNNMPYIVEQVDGVNKSVTRIHEIYQQNYEIFNNEANRIRSSDSNIGNLEQSFNVILDKDRKKDMKSTHILWRINRMTPARILRQIFPAPKTIPEHAGIDIERYIAFDINGGITYRLPSTDCSNMFIHQAIGSRIIHLKPTVECKDQCRRITVKLNENHTLFYDWWYWKPISSPVQQLIKTTSVSYIGAYCI